MADDQTPKPQPIEIALSIEGGDVTVMFSKPVDTLKFTPDMARQMAARFTNAAIAIEEHQKKAKDNIINGVSRTALTQGGK